MTRRGIVSGLVCAAALALVGCDEGVTVEHTTTQAGLTSDHYNGTLLMGEVTAHVGQCVTGGAMTWARVDLRVTLTSNGSASAAHVTLGGDLSNRTTYTIEPQDWAFEGGRLKAHFSTETLRLTTGRYEVQVCARQPGADGNTHKAVCRWVDVRVACSRTDGPRAHVNR